MLDVVSSERRTLAKPNEHRMVALNYEMGPRRIARAKGEAASALLCRFRRDATSPGSDDLVPRCPYPHAR